MKGRMGNAAFFLALFVALAAPLRAALGQSVVVENIKITVSVAGETVSHFAFVPVRVIVENRQARDLHWEAVFQSESYATGLPCAGRWTQSFVVPASRTSERWFFVPSIEAGLLNRPGYYGAAGNIRVTFDGTGIRATTVQLGMRGVGAMNQMVPWAVSPALEPAARAQIAAFQAGSLPSPAAGSRPRGMRGAAFSTDLATVDMTQALGDWRIWAPYSRVVVTDAEYASMPAPNRAALRNWVALGGALYLAPTTPLPRSEAQRFGLGTITKYDRPITAETRAVGALFEGRALLSSTLAVPSAGDMSLQKSGLSAKMPPAKKVGDWMVYFFIGFALLVGPVNLFAIAPVKRRQRLFLTVPVISLAAVAALVIAIWLQDGVGGDGTRRSLVVLLPGDNQAAVIQEQVARSGLLFGSGFALAEDTVCTPVATDDPNANRGRAFEYARQENRASGDWFRSRARQAHHLRRLTPTRARIEQVGAAPDGAPIIQSSVGATLRDFHFVNSAGSWTARELPPGTRVTLARATGEADVAARIEVFGSAGSIHFQAVVRGCGAVEPGHFFATAGESDLAPIATLPGIRWSESAVAITGVVETSGAASPAAR